MIEIHIDFETRSDVDIHKRGSHVYFESPLTQPLMASYAVADGPIKRWLPDEPCPDDIRGRAESGGRFVAHNAGAFEFLLWTKILTPRYGWPATTLEQWRCTMAAASALGLPRSLERLGAALGLAVKKDKIGKSLIDFFSAPRPNRACESGVHFNQPREFPEKFEQFRDYCDNDVRSEREADARMIPLSEAEIAVWRLSEAINQRGVRIDRRSAEAAIRLIDKETAALDAQMSAATGGAATACSQAARLTKWLQARGVAMDGVAKDDILEAFDRDDSPDDVRRALTLRQTAAKPSTRKLTALLAAAGHDDRARGAFIYHGTAPGRWSSVGVNLYNMPRPRPSYDDADLDPATLFAAIRQEDPELLRAIYGPELGKPLHLVSDAIRGFLIAAPGKDFVAVDYSGIQGALCAWLSDEKWKLQAMAEIIADPTLPDLYRRAGAGILGVGVDIVTKKHWGRQIGKVAELALGFQGSVAALVSMAANYGMRRRALHDLYPGVWKAADEAARERAVKRYEQRLKSRDRQKTDVLSREAWLACMLVVNGWRKHNARIQAAWPALEDAMRAAIRNPGAAQRALGRIDYLYKSGFLWARLPSGRCIAYARPRLRDQVWAKLRLADLSWGEAEVVDREEAEKLEMRGQAAIQGATSPKVTALGVDSTTQKLTRYALYAGLAMENACLAIESDILRVGLANCERAGYPIVLHVYDEAVAEMARERGSVDEMVKLMLDLPSCYAGLPLTAHGYRAKRYAKK